MIPRTDRVERAIERYVTSNSRLQGELIEFIMQQARREEELRRERALEQNDLKILHTRQLEELRLARESAERKQERKEDELLNPKEPLCKMYANSAEEFTNETDKFEEQLFDH